MKNILPSFTYFFIKVPTEPKTSSDSCNFNSPGNERALPSKLVELGQHIEHKPSSKPVVINQADVTRSDNLAASSWSNAPLPGRVLPSPSPRHGPVNGPQPRRDSESSGLYL